MSNESENRAAIDRYRKELKAMFDDISDIDVKVLNKAVNAGMADAAKNTPVLSGFMRGSWFTSHAVKLRDGVAKVLMNSADYSSFVNDGHRVVNKSGETVGFIKGKYMLEHAIDKVDKTMAKEFEKEVERVNKKHDH